MKGLNMSIIIGTLLTLGQAQGGMLVPAAPPPSVPVQVVPQQVVPVVPQYPVAQPALTLSQAKSLLCRLPPGPQRITFVHPHTCCPVTVCFCLPCGCYEIECGKGLLCNEKLRFDFKKGKDVVIKFHKDGSVSVKD